jgi:hypothetical protein
MALPTDTDFGIFGNSTPTLILRNREILLKIR